MCETSPDRPAIDGVPRSIDCRRKSIPNARRAEYSLLEHLHEHHAGSRQSRQREQDNHAIPNGIMAFVLTQLHNALRRCRTSHVLHGDLLDFTSARVLQINDMTARMRTGMLREFTGIEHDFDASQLEDVAMLQQHFLPRLKSLAIETGAIRAPFIPKHVNALLRLEQRAVMAADRGVWNRYVTTVCAAYCIAFIRQLE